MTSLLEFPPLYQEDATTVRARIDADANSGLALDDPRRIDTREGTFFWDVTQPLVLEFARIWDALSVEVPAAGFAVYAWGSYLDDHAEVFDLERKAAVAADGTVYFVGDPGTLVGSGTTVSTDILDSDGNPIEFITTTSGTTGDQLDPPASLTPTPSASGGTLATDDYYYVATAYNEFGETTASVEATAAVTGPTGSVALDWPNVTGATGYRLYRGLVSGGEKGRIYDGAVSAYTDTGAVTPGVVVPEINLTAGIEIAVEAVEEGTVGNVAAGAIINLDTPNLGIDEVTNPDATQGGTDVELDEALRERIILEYQGRGAGNVNDYRRWALAYPGVGRVFVNPVWDGPGTVQVVVMTENGDPVAAGVVTGLQAELDPTSGQGGGTAPIGAVVTVQTPSVVTIDVSATVTFEAGYSLDGGGGTTARRTEIVEALTGYVNDLDVGEDVVYEHVKARFFRVEGVYNIASVTVEGGTSNVTITSDPPQTAQLATPALS